MAINRPVSPITKTAHAGRLEQLLVAEAAQDAAAAAAENDGVATITAATSTVVVAHGLTGTPTIINVTPRETIAAASFLWVDTIGATNFTINTNANVTADADFGWEAKL